MLDALRASISYDPVQRWGPVSPHGVGTAGGFLLGAMLMARRAEPRGIPRAETYNAVTWGAIGAILGARGFYVLAHLDQFTSLQDVVAVWQGGLTMFGGFVGGLLFGIGYLWRRGYDIPHALDAAAPGFVVGVIIGRIGDLIIADHLGEPTDFFLGYRIPEGAQLAPGYNRPPYVPGAVVHHTALYDLFGALILLGVLYLLGRRHLPRGGLFAAFSIWYGVQRIGLDFTRNREVIESFFYGLSGSQWAGLAFALFGIGWLLRARLRGDPPIRRPEEPGSDGVPRLEEDEEAEMTPVPSAGPRDVAEEGGVPPAPVPEPSVEDAAPPASVEDREAPPPQDQSVPPQDQSVPPQDQSVPPQASSEGGVQEAPIAEEGPTAAPMAGPLSPPSGQEATETPEAPEAEEAPRPTEPVPADDPERDDEDAPAEVEGQEVLPFGDGSSSGTPDEDPGPNDRS